MRLSVLPLADLEASEAALWYDDRRPGLGDDFVADLRNAFERILDGPRTLAKLEYYRGARELRRNLLSRFPYLVAAVSHVRRQPLYWLDRLNG